MTDKKVYIVRGNHDGNIGVYTNIKKAYNAAILYAGDKPVLSFIKGEIKEGTGRIIYRRATYNWVVAKLKKISEIEIYENENEETIATIQRFYLNN